MSNSNNGKMSEKKTNTGKRNTGDKKKTVRNSGGSDNNAVRKKTVGKRKNSARITAKERKELELRKSFMIKEAVFVLGCFLALFLFLSNFGLLGSVGAFFSSIQKGCFGAAAYVFPILLVLLVFFTATGRHTSVFWLKFGCSIVLFITVISLIQMAFGTKELMSFSWYYNTAKEGRFYDAAAGGAIGGSLSAALVKVIARVGAWLLLLAIAVTCSVVLSEKSIIAWAKRSAQSASEAAKKGSESAERMLKEERVRMEARREARVLRRKEEAFERDIDTQAEMPSIASNTFDMKAVRANQMSDFTGTFQNQEALGDAFDQVISLKNDPVIDEQAAQSNSMKMAESGHEANSDNTIYSNQEEKITEETDYFSDEVPFLETAQEKYKAYGKMLSSGKLDLKAAQQMGFAVSVGSDYSVKEPVNSHYEAFKSEFEEYLHQPLDPDEIEYPETVLTEKPVEFSGFDMELDEEGKGNTADNKIEDPQIMSPYSSDQTSWFDAKEIDSANDIEAENEIKSEDHISEGTNTEIPLDYDSIYHITDEDRNEVYDAREKAAGKDEPYEPFSHGKGLDNLTKPHLKKNTTAQNNCAGEVKQQPPATPVYRPYQFPPVSLLAKGMKSQAVNTDDTRANALKLQQVLAEFGVGVRVTNVVKGPRVTRYELTPDIGVKVSRITSLAGDIKLALAASELRIEAPIPGKSAVGIEVPNADSVTVSFRDIMDSSQFKDSKSKLTWGVGLDIQGAPVVGDIAKMPHLLVAGTTGSGKSVGINSIIMSVIYRAKPEEVRMILVDPKVVELSVYDGIPHLLAPVVTKPEQALAVLNKACAEMAYRYNLFKESGTRNIAGYNQKVEEISKSLPEGSEKPEKLPYILIIIDELSELMMHSKRDVESAIVSLTQLARAAGIHLVVATQRPDVSVVTGLIKSNIPSRVAYHLPSGVDSRTVLDSYGAEALLGNGDMLYKPGDKNNPLRVQGAFLADSEVESVVEWLRKHNISSYDEAWTDLKGSASANGTGSGRETEETANDDGRDAYFTEAGLFITEKKKASIGLLQRKFKIGFNRASRIMEQLCDAGVVSEGEGTKERQILMTPEEFKGGFS